MRQLESTSPRHARRPARSLPAVLALLAFAAFPASALAQASRTWVSGVGDDANPCSRTAPCKTFAGAISKTAIGGEIDVLDPGGFGALTITKAITIDGGGGQNASVLVAGTNGFVVAAGANDKVIIRNLRFQGISGGPNGGLNGIRVVSAHSVLIENVDINNFTQNCVDFAPSAFGQRVIVTDSRLYNCAGDGVLLEPTGPGANRITLNNDQISENGNGVVAGTGTGVSALNTIVNSRITDNVGNGVQSNGSSSLSVIDGDTISTNGTGVQDTASGGMFTFGNNHLIFNGTDIGAGTTLNALSGHAKDVASAESHLWAGMVAKARAWMRAHRHHKHKRARHH
jgi:parallel beta helix pectate lyase-like protein